MSDDRFDIAIIGAGPAGLMAAIETARQGVSAMVISDETPGGLALAARRLDNLPGYPDGARPVEWVAGLVTQVRQAGIPLVRGRVEKLAERDQTWLVRAGSLEVRSLAVVVATGTRPVRYIPPLAESPLIHRDLRTVPADLAGKKVAVIGSGEAAVDTALSIHDRGAVTTLLARGDNIHACPPLLAELARSPVDVVFKSPVDRIHCLASRIRVCGPALRDGRAFDHIVIAIGREPRTGEIEMPVGLHFVPAGVAGPIPGLYFAGDILRSRDRYVVSAMGDGQQAACLAIRHINSRSCPQCTAIQRRQTRRTSKSFP